MVHTMLPMELVGTCLDVNRITAQMGPRPRGRGHVISISTTPLSWYSQRVRLLNIEPFGLDISFTRLICFTYHYGAVPDVFDNFELRRVADRADHMYPPVPSHSFMMALLLLSLPTELFEEILGSLSRTDIYSLLLVSAALYNRWHILIQARLLRCHIKKTLLCLSNVEDEDDEDAEFGYSPFLITSIQSSSTPITITIVSPPFNKEKYESDLPIQIEQERVFLSSEYFDDEFSESQYAQDCEAGREITVKLEDCISRGLVFATGSLLRDRFTCIECGGEEVVCPGCGGFSRR